jgi:hypothetical protein
MTLRDALSERRESIHAKWLEDTLATYPTDAAGFFRRERNRFDNPVGHTFSENTRAVTDAFIDGLEEAKGVAEHLEKLIKIRSIQEMSASEAVGFIFRLKNVVRTELAKELREPQARAELIEIEQDVDTLALMAFDAYAHCREQLFDIRVDEVKRTVSGLVRRLNREDENQQPPVENVTRNR